MQFTNVHAGICAFVGVGSDGREEILIEKPISTLQSQELKDSQCGLQSALLQVIQNSMDATKEKNFIRSQMISTLPLYVNFPLLLPPIKPGFSMKQRVFTTIGKFFLKLMITR
jgi:hypothetical protein